MATAKKAKTTAKPATPTAYIESLAEPRRSEIAKLDALIREAAPSLSVSMQGGIIGYGKYHYRYASGREGDSFVIGLSARAQYISLYLSSADATGYLAEKRAPAIGKVKVGRSCISIRKLEDIDLARTKELLVEAAKFRGSEPLS